MYLLIYNELKTRMILYAVFAVLLMISIYFTEIQPQSLAGFSNAYPATSDRKNRVHCKFKLFYAVRKLPLGIATSWG